MSANRRCSIGSSARSSHWSTICPALREALPAETAVPHDEDAGAEFTPAELDARPIRVAVVGRPNSGKSTLVNRLLGQDRLLTGPEAGITRDSIAVDLDWNGRRFRV